MQVNQVKIQVKAEKNPSIPAGKVTKDITSDAAFTLGQSVKAVAFTNCFGEFVPERYGLTVTEIRLIEGNGIKPYFRIKADSPDGFGYVEGAERFFAEDHATDADCAPYLVDDSCSVCGVDHSDQCVTCGGRGFHNTPLCEVSR